MYRPPEVKTMDKLICKLYGILQSTYQIPEWMNPPKEILQARWKSYLGGEGVDDMAAYLRAVDELNVGGE